MYLAASTRSQVATAQHGDHGFPKCRILCPDIRDMFSSALPPFQKDVTTRQPLQLTFKSVSLARTTDLRRRPQCGQPDLRARREHLRRGPPASNNADSGEGLRPRMRPCGRPAGVCPGAGSRVFGTRDSGFGGFNLSPEFGLIFTPSDLIFHPLVVSLG